MVAVSPRSSTAGSWSDIYVALLSVLWVYCAFATSAIHGLAGWPG
jgi:hypothetical protein